jgi:hypothetical protein
MNTPGFHTPTIVQEAGGLRLGVKGPDADGLVWLLVERDRRSTLWNLGAPERTSLASLALKLRHQQLSEQEIRSFWSQVSPIDGMAPEVFRLRDAASQEMH